MVSHAEAAARALKFDEVTDLLAETHSNERRLRANDFAQDRGIFKRGAADNLNHIDFFGDSYLPTLKNLGEDDVWLHIGPGNFYAEVDYFSSPLFTKHAKVISNSYCLSDSPDAVSNLAFLEQFKRDGKFDCIHGIKFQDLKDRFPYKATAISDVFAAGSYDQDLFGFFRTASELLLPHGMFAVVLATVSFNSVDGRSIPAPEIYQSMRAFELVNQTENNGWVFRRTNETFVEPRNELAYFAAANFDKGICWPIRRYNIL